MTKGTKYLSVSRKAKTYGEDRVCELVNCDVTLSKYNKEVLCFLHSPKKSGRVRGWKEPT